MGALSNVASIVLLVVVYVGGGWSMSEESFATIRGMTTPMVSVFYEPEAATSHLWDTMKQVQKTQKQFGFFKCDITLKRNRKHAEKSKMNKGVHVFVRAADGGIEEYTDEVTVEGLHRFLDMSNLNGNPADVLKFVSEDALYELMDNSPSEPVLVAFVEDWCAHCFRLKTPLRQAATHFKGVARVMEVTCSSNDSTQEFCGANSVEKFPTLKVFTLKDTIDFTGGRSVYAIEKFLVDQGLIDGLTDLGKANRGQSESSGTPAPKAAPKAATTKAAPKAATPKAAPKAAPSRPKTAPRVAREALEVDVKASGSTSAGADPDAVQKLEARLAEQEELIKDLMYRVSVLERKLR